MSKQLPGSETGLAELLPLRRVRIIAVDIDGTVVPAPSDPVSRRISRQRNALMKLSVLTTLATGRAYAGAKEIMRTLVPKSTVPVILYNGAVILERKSGKLKLSYIKNLPAETVREVVVAAVAVGLIPMVYSCSSSYEPDLNLQNTSELLETVHGIFHTPTEQADFNGLEIVWSTVKEYVPHEAVAIVIKHGNDPETLAAFAHAISRRGDLSITTSSSAHIEVRPAGVSKAAALSWLAAKRHLTADQIMAIGDNDNDVEMLMWAGVGIAVANASSTAKDAADYVTAGESANGVLEAMQRISDSRYFFRHNDRLPIFMNDDEIET
jgi:Cof subfamily protein (haloacid dehalogenase superfamily)